MFSYSYYRVHAHDSTALPDVFQKEDAVMIIAEAFGVYELTPSRRCYSNITASSQLAEGCLTSAFFRNNSARAFFAVRPCKTSRKKKLWTQACSYVRPPVCLSVCHKDQGNNAAIAQRLVYWCQRSRQNSTDVTANGYRCGRLKSAIIDQYSISLYLRNGASVGCSTGYVPFTPLTLNGLNSLSSGHSSFG